MTDLVYLDANSAPPLAPEALAAMLPFLETHHGNAASTHAAGRRLADAVERGRGELAALIGARPEELVFTGGGTESNNWVLAGAAAPRTGGHLVISSVEHFSIAEGARRLAAERGVEVTVVPVDGTGSVDVAGVVDALRDDTFLVSLMLAQNEVGTLQPVAEVAAAARARGIPVHTDAAQAVGKVPVDTGRLGVDFLSVAGHKLYGPKGIGALWIRPGAAIAPWMLGAPHERGLRAGTLNVPAIVGLGAAATASRRYLESDGGKTLARARRLFDRLAARVPGLSLNGTPFDDPARLPNTVNVSFPGVRSFELLPLAPGVAASGGAACHSGDPKPSATLLALGLSRERALGAVRLSLCRATTDDEVDRAADRLADAFDALRRSA